MIGNNKDFIILFFYLEQMIDIFLNIKNRGEDNVK